MRTLILNTYGGSLLLGATAAGAEIIGSYEDVGFGTPIQRLNFPNIDVRAKREEWPTQNLSETIVMAHPPCSAFSVQNNSPRARGIDSDAFSCTKKILEYAIGNGAVAICVESVIGALSGAWGVHQRFADDNGYDLYRVLQCGAMFGPQWRERFWAIWVKRGAVPSREMTLRLTPRWQTVGQALEGYTEGPGAGNTDALLVKLKADTLRDLPLSPGDFEFFFDPQDPPHRTQGFARAVQRHMFPDEPIDIVSRDFLGITFSTGQMCYVNPNGLAPCILGSSWFYVNGKNVTEEGYKRLMGFPADYAFPEGPIKRNMRTYLSKGVMPPVAKWVYEQVTTHLGDRKPPKKKPTYEVTIPPDRIADFRFKKRAWGDAAPALRHHEDEEVSV